YTPATVVLDSPLVVEIPGAPDWRPRNFENSYFGRIILKGALERSLNTVAARTILATGPEAMVGTLSRLGVQAPLQPHYSLALGGASLSALEMAGYIASIADEGAVVQPYLIKRVEDTRGNLLEEHIITFDRQFTPEKVYLLIDMLKGVIEEGTGRGVRRYGFTRPAIGKTGTSNDYRDSWFIGATPRYAASVWVGFDDNRPMRPGGGGRITGASGALPIWARFMTSATEGEPVRDFSIPPGIEFRLVNLHDGSAVDSLDENAVRVALPLGTVLPEPAPEPMSAFWDSSGTAPPVFTPLNGEVQ
ncbi:MAG TPA: peptidase, partial [Bacteroidetes bacterium]|nr:peptidase [Bacteroidota bacterium]